jgi:hypothetical protein
MSAELYGIGDIVFPPKIWELNESDNDQKKEIKKKETQVDKDVQELLDMSLLCPVDALKLLMWCDWMVDRAKTIIKIAGPEPEGIMDTAYEGIKKR